MSTAMVASLGGCGSSSSGSSSGGTKGPIKIGAAIGVTGSMQPYDYEAYTTAEMAADDINAAGGIDGRKIQFVLTDAWARGGHSGDQQGRAGHAGLLRLRHGQPRRAYCSVEGRGCAVPLCGRTGVRPPGTADVLGWSGYTRFGGRCGPVGVEHQEVAQGVRPRGHLE